MMYGREKSDPAIVATKPANNAGKLAAEWVEPRAVTEGNASQTHTRLAQNRGSPPARHTRAEAQFLWEIFPRHSRLQHIQDAMESRPI